MNALFQYDHPSMAQAVAMLPVDGTGQLNARAVSLSTTLGKITLLAFVMVWARVAWPRLREDQLQKMSWLVLVPLSLLNIFVVAIGKVAF